MRPNCLLPLAGIEIDWEKAMHLSTKKKDTLVRILMIARKVKIGPPLAKFPLERVYRFDTQRVHWLSVGCQAVIAS